MYYNVGIAQCELKNQFGECCIRKWVTLIHIHTLLVFLSKNYRPLFYKFIFFFFVFEMSLVQSQYMMIDDSVEEKLHSFCCISSYNQQTCIV